ncbi:MAG: hypothetical protein Q4D56_13545 [Bacteroides sp.]|nr:hypothetical protein [Bacteroides sp.]
MDDEHVNLWSKTIDYSGQSLYEEEGVKLSWEKCMLSGSLDGHFYFSFISEEKALPGGLEFKTGKLNNFFCFLDGNLGLDLMLKLEAAIKESHDFSKPILSDFVNLTVPFNVGGIPFSVTIKADLIAEASFAAEAQATLSGGFNAGVGTKFGMNYINESLLPIWEPGYHFNVYPPTLEVSGTVDAQATIYPYYKIRFYNFAGPNIAYKDYLKMGAAMGARVSTDPTLNYAGWTACVYTQPELEISLALDFIGIHATSEPWTKPSETKNYLFEAPKKIELVSPQEDGRSYQIGEPIDVTFRVTGELYEKDPLPTWKAIVQANAFGGQSDKEFYQTDENGEFTVTYIPQEEGSRLGVYIVNEKGEPFAGAAFTPDLEQDKLVGQWGINAGAVMNGSEISWIDVLTFKSDGTYTYESNPSKLALYWTDANGITYSRIHYSYCSGTYVFDEAGEKLTLQASYASDVTIRDGVETPNDPQSTLVANLFGRSGVYIARIESDGRLIIIHEGWQEGITGSAFFPIDNTSRFASRSIANGVYEIGQQKFQTSQEIVYPYPKP